METKELKFKAWHREQQKMYWFDLMWGNFGRGGGWIGMVEWGKPRYSDKIYNGNQTLIDPTECDILFSSGIEDVHCREIFDGDIVSVTTKHIADLDPKAPETTTIVEVKFERGMFLFGDMTMQYGGLERAKLEINGNIYENKELLNK